MNQISRDSKYSKYNTIYNLTNTAFNIHKKNTDEIRKRECIESYPNLCETAIRADEDFDKLNCRHDLCKWGHHKTADFMYGMYMTGFWVPKLFLQIFLF